MVGVGVGVVVGVGVAVVVGVVVVVAVGVGVGVAVAVAVAVVVVVAVAVAVAVVVGVGVGVAVAVAVVSQGWVQTYWDETAVRLVHSWAGVGWILALGAAVAALWVVQTEVCGPPTSSLLRPRAFAVLSPVLGIALGVNPWLQLAWRLPNGPAWCAVGLLSVEAVIGACVWVEWEAHLAEERRAAAVGRPAVQVRVIPTAARRAVIAVAARAGRPLPERPAPTQAPAIAGRAVLLGTVIDRREAS